ncbi:MAG: SRPBCC family protein, partial [Thermomicrobiales bacterium]
MRAYESSAEIDAPAEDVWAVLVDGPNYTSWESGVEKFEGAIAPGSTIRVYSEAASGRAFPVKVVELEPSR